MSINSATLVLGHGHAPRFSMLFGSISIIVIGEVLDEDDWNKDNETFVRTLYCKIRANWDGLYEDDIILWLNKLESGEETRENMVKTFMTDAILANRYALYDLENDPYEEANLLLIDRAKYKDIVIAMKTI